MDANECKQERFSSRSIGLVFLVVSLLLIVSRINYSAGGRHIFTFPLVILGIMLVAAPESRACRMLRQGFRAG